MDFIEKTLEKEEIYKGKIIKVNRHKVQLPNGKTSVREVVNHPGGVAVVAIKDDGNIIFVEQFRKPIEKVLLEIPAGKIEKGEDIRVTAERELEEETGYRAKVFTYLGKVVTSPGFCDEYIHLFKAEELYQGNIGGDDDEFIDLHYFSLEEAKEKIKNGTIEDAKTICAINLIM